MKSNLYIIVGDRTRDEEIVIGPEYEVSESEWEEEEDWEEPDPWFFPPEETYGF